MQKPDGWQDEQAVEIRRDWIAYLAEGMGIDADVTGPELETLVVRRMLDHAVSFCVTGRRRLGGSSLYGWIRLWCPGDEGFTLVN